jgi:hypothetical protein
MMSAASLLAAWAAMTGFAFQAPSQRHRLGLAPQRRARRALHALAASALLALSLAAAMQANGKAFGLVLWLCQACVLGLAATCLFPYAQRMLTRSSAVAALAAPLLFGLTWFNPI